MTAEAIDAELARDPYVPIRLHLSDGQTLDIFNSGLTMIAHNALYVARTDRPGSRIADDFKVVSVSHVVSLEKLEPAERP